MNRVRKIICKNRVKSIGRNIKQRKSIGRRKSIKKASLIALAILSISFLCAFAMEDGEYSVSVDISGGSGKASVTSPTLLTVKDGIPVARIQWSSSNYDYMIVDGAYYYNQSEEGMNSVFEIPVLCWDEEMNVIADTTAMGNPVEVHYQFLFYRDSLGSKNELPQEAAKRVLCVAFVIIAAGGVLNYIIKKKSS
ncbi:MAG: hypothetical protein HFG80_07475 [Eubacterium sp.]|nr:hypothetical protein [Eubacterium sp.]